MKLCFTRRRGLAGIGACMLLVGVSATASQLRTDFEKLRTEIDAWSSRSRGVGEGPWADAQRALTALSERAVMLDDRETFVECALLKARALVAFRQQREEAVAVLRQAAAQPIPGPTPLMSRLYMQAADYLAELGREDEIRALIADFKASPHYVPESYGYTGGQGRNVPLQIVRPSSATGGSLAITAMEEARRRARVAAGDYFPDFSFRDTRGNLLASPALRGRVVLVDCWTPAWPAWQQGLPLTLRAYEKFHKHGFEIIGIGLNMDPAALTAYAARAGMAWPLVEGAQAKPLLKKIGLHGEVANFLLDRQGRVIGRNLYGSDLLAAVQAALAE